jgi:hypothetical protein
MSIGLQQKNVHHRFIDAIHILNTLLPSSYSYYSWFNEQNPQPNGMMFFARSTFSVLKHDDGPWMAICCRA